MGLAGSVVPFVASRIGHSHYDRCFVHSSAEALLLLELGELERLEDLDLAEEVDIVRILGKWQDLRSLVQLEKLQEPNGDADSGRREDGLDRREEHLEEVEEHDSGAEDTGWLEDGSDLRE